MIMWAINRFVWCFDAVLPLELIDIIIMKQETVVFSWVYFVIIWEFMTVAFRFYRKFCLQFSCKVNRKPGRVFQNRFRLTSCIILVFFFGKKQCLSGIKNSKMGTRQFLKIEKTCNLLHSTPGIVWLRFILGLEGQQIDKWKLPKIRKIRSYAF